MPDSRPFPATVTTASEELDLIAVALCVPEADLYDAAVQAIIRLRHQAEVLRSTTYHPGSFAFAMQAMADDLERIAGTLRGKRPDGTDFWAVSAIADTAEQIEHQVRRLRDIAAKQWDQPEGGMSWD